MNTNEHSLLYLWASKFLKYLLLSLLGVAIACILSTTLGTFQIAEFLLSSLIGWFLRLGIIAFTLLVAAIVFESWR
jgi:hypothetical protein